VFGFVTCICAFLLIRMWQPNEQQVNDNAVIASWQEWSSQDIVMLLHHEPVEAFLTEVMHSGFNVTELATQIEVRNVDGETLNIILQDPACIVLQTISGLDSGDCLKLADALRDTLSAHQEICPYGKSRHHEFWSDSNAWKLGLGWAVAFSAFVAFVFDCFPSKSCAVAFSALVAFVFDCFPRKCQATSEQRKVQAVIEDPDTEIKVMKVMAAFQRIQELSKTSHEGEEHPPREQAVTSESVSDDALAQKVADGDSCRRRSTAVESSDPS